MHTPRFSGQPCSAGDFVLARICSRPWRTNCANVGTVLPRSNQISFHSPRLQTHTRRVSLGFYAERASSDCGGTAKNSTPIPAHVLTGLATAEKLTRLCGAGAPFRPLPSPRSVLPCSGAGDLPFHQQGLNPPDKTLSIGKRLPCVKQKCGKGGGKLFAPVSPGLGSDPLPRRAPAKGYGAGTRLRSHTRR